MKKGIKYALIFTSGAALGFSVCGVKLFGYALKDEDIRGGIVNKITRKLVKTVYGDDVDDKQRSNKYEYKSYRKYYDECREVTKYNDVIFDCAADAEAVVDNLKEIIKQYGHATVAELYDFVGIEAAYSDTKYGWTNMRYCKIKPCKNGYTLVIPTPLPLNK